MKTEIKGFNGHIVLYCKNHYNHSKDLIEDLKKIWAVRCGYPYNESDNSSVKPIINDLYKILLSIEIDNNVFQEQLHDHLLNYMYRQLSVANNLLYFYIGRIANTQIKEKVGGQWTTLIELPKPKKQLFNRIIRGNGRYEDYKLIKE